MENAALEARIDRLEEALMMLAYQARKTEMEVERLSKEMKEFKNEMREFKDEMKAFKDEMKEFKDEMREFKDEMRAFKDEMNKKWGDLANKLGTLAENIIAPGMPAVIKKNFNTEVEELSVRRRKRLKDKVREYDVIVVAGKYVFVVDVKSKYRKQHIEEFEKSIRDFYEFFPEYKKFELLPIIASFNLTDEVVNLATSKNWLALQMFGDYLEFVNLDKIIKRLSQNCRD